MRGAIRDAQRSSASRPSDLQKRAQSEMLEPLSLFSEGVKEGTRLVCWSAPRFSFAQTEAISPSPLPLFPLILGTRQALNMEPPESPQLPVHRCLRHVPHCPSSVTGSVYTEPPPSLG